MGDVSSLGSAKSVRVTKDSTTILDGSGMKAEVDERTELIREQIDKTTSTYEKDKLKERLASLAGGVAVIKGGGASEFEQTGEGHNNAAGARSRKQRRRRSRCMRPPEQLS